MRWKSFQENQRLSIRGGICNIYMEIAKQPNLDSRMKHYLVKLNEILVAIVKQEWNTTWPTFIQEICSAAKTNQNLCENIMMLLKILSEEIFDFSKNSNRSTQVAQLKTSMTKDFGCIFELCNFVFETHKSTPTVVNNSLIKNTLKTFEAFMSWIPLGYLFETEIIDKLVNQFLLNSNFRVETLKCLYEISCLRSTVKELDTFSGILIKMFVESVQKLSNLIGTNRLSEERKNIDSKMLSGFDNFCHILAQYLGTFINNHLDLIENFILNPNSDSQPKEILTQVLSISLYYLVDLGYSGNEEVFKICIEFWNSFVNNYYTRKAYEVLKPEEMMQNTNMTPLTNSNLNFTLYPNVLHEVKILHVSKMPKPKEVLIVVDEATGEAEEEVIKDTESISLYDTMRNTLIWLTLINSKETSVIMSNVLGKYMSENPNNFEALNRLCWAVGSIHDAMPQEEEKAFLVSLIKDLLSLVELKKGKSSKAIVAANIMYVVGQYPFFLKNHWKFLKTVIRKLNEFMHEKHPGVQDMSCETFLKISLKCRDEFVKPQESEEPYIFNILSSLLDDIKDLNQHQKRIVYEGIGHMISAEPDIKIREILLKKLMEFEDVKFQNIINQAKTNIELLYNHDNLRDLDFFFKMNISVASSVGGSFDNYISTIYVNILHIYTIFSSRINQQIIANNNMDYNDSWLKGLKLLRKNVLTLISTFISKSKDTYLLSRDFIPSLNSLLDDYLKSSPNARDPEVLLLFSVIIENLRIVAANGLEDIMVKLGAPTIEMISIDFESFPEHRMNYFTLLKNIVVFSFEGFRNLQPNSFKNFVNSILWGLKHYQLSIMEMGLETLKIFMEKISQDKNAYNNFLSEYFLSIVKEIFFVLTDSLHKSGFKLQAEILRILVLSIANNIFYAPIDPKFSDNLTFFKDFLFNALIQTFKNISRDQIIEFINGMVEKCSQWEQFKVCIRDFLISLNEFSATSNQGLYLEEVALEKKKKEEMENSKMNALKMLQSQGPN